MSGIDTILNAAQAGKAPSKDALLELLYLDENSSETLKLRETANAVMRKRFSNKVLPMGQIGIEIAPCPGNCKFCAFAEDVNTASAFWTNEEIVEKSKEMVESGKLYGLFLMAMHNFDRDRILEICSLVRKEIPQNVNLIANVGDAPKDYFIALKKVGVSGAYHVQRLREGVDTSLNPQDRIATIEAIKSAGLNWYTCCEPIGAEHTNEEILEQMLIAMKFDCFQNAAMARVNFPNSPLAKYGEISKQRLAQIVAIVALSSIESKELASVAVHEPNMLSLMSGANSMSAEYGKNPRDTAVETSKNRGRSVEDILKMFADAGFDV